MFLAFCPILLDLRPAWWSEGNRVVWCLGILILKLVWLDTDCGFPV